MPIPNFILIGAPKSGTSSLYQYLKQHPDVFLSVPKEPYFFVAREEKEKWFALGLKPVMSEEDYLQLFEQRRNEKIIGEASAPYLFSKETPALIHDRIAEIKMVAVLRNPIDRAYSQFNFLRGLGIERLTKFAEAIEEEDRRFAAGAPQFLLYKRRGLYGEQLARYYEVFDRSKLRIYLHEQLDEDAMSVIKDIFSFLEIDTAFTPDISQRHNPTLVEAPNIAERLVSGLRRNMPGMSSRREESSDLMIGTLNNLPDSSARQRKLVKASDMDKDLRKRLASYFENDVHDLSKLLGKDLTGWLSV